MHTRVLARWDTAQAASMHLLTRQLTLGKQPSYMLMILILLILMLLLLLMLRTQILLALMKMMTLMMMMMLLLFLLLQLLLLLLLLQLKGAVVEELYAVGWGSDRKLDLRGRQHRVAGFFL